MKLAKSILGGIAALGITAGAAFAADDTMPDIGNGSFEYFGEPIVVYEETWVIAPSMSDEQVAWNDFQADDPLTNDIYALDSALSTDLALAPADAYLLIFGEQELQS